MLSKWCIGGLRRNKPFAACVSMVMIMMMILVMVMVVMIIWGWWWWLQCSSGRGEAMERSQVVLPVSVGYEGAMHCNVMYMYNIILDMRALCTIWCNGIRLNEKHEDRMLIWIMICPHLIKISLLIVITFVYAIGSIVNCQLSCTACQLFLSIDRSRQVCCSFTVEYEDDGTMQRITFVNTMMGRMRSWGGDEEAKLPGENWHFLPGEILPFLSPSWPAPSSTLS